MGERPASLAVVGALAAVRGVDGTDLPPLQESVDTDALDALFDGGPSADLSVTFVVDDAEVTVSGLGRVHVRASAPSA